MSQCKGLQNVSRGSKNMTYAYGTAQYHWGVSPKEHWVLYDIKKDPGCKNDLSQQKLDMIRELSTAYDTWWDNLFPEMIAKGGDLGNPNQSRKSVR
jgi:hypothetical protein